MAAALKEEATALFRVGDLAGALEQYNEALKIASEATDSESVELRRNLHSNVSMVLLKQGDAAGAALAADQCIVLAPSWAKGHYRRGSALLQLLSDTEGLPDHEDRAKANQAFRKVCLPVPTSRLVDSRS